MNWLAPGFLAGALLIALPLALHFLRRKPPTVLRFPSLRFLGATALRDTRRHRLLRWLTLLLRCLAIALLAAAFARPFWRDAVADRSQAMVIALDNSMSMQAAGRWEERRRRALEQLDELHPGDRAALLLMHPTPVWLLPMTDDLAAVRRRLQEARPGFEKTKFADPLRVAADFLAAQAASERTIVWLADDQRLGWFGANFEQTLPPGVKLRLQPPAPAPARQAAIVNAQLSPGLDPGLEVTVRQFQPERDQRRVSVQAAGKILVEQTISLRAGENKIALKFNPPAADGLRVSLDADDLPADDTAWLATAKSVSDTVLLDAEPDVDFVAHALRSTHKLTAGGFEPSVLPEQDWPVGAVAILRGAAAFRSPRVEQLDRFFDNGGPLWIFVDGSPEQIAWLEKHGIRVTARREAGEPWHLRDWDDEHPALAAFAGQSLLPLLEVEYRRGFDLASARLSPLANWPDGKPALAEWSDHGHRLLLCGFSANRDATEWPAQTSFVPFVHQAVRWLGSFSGKRGQWRVGDTIPLPAEAGTWHALNTAAPSADVAVSGSVRADVPGLYEFRAGNIHEVFAVNILPEESDLSPWPNAEQLAALESKNAAVFQSSIAPASEVVVENRQRLWWWAFALCGVIVLAELALANRASL